MREHGRVLLPFFSLIKLDMTEDSEEGKGTRRFEREKAVFSFEPLTLI